jgi:hypothetical protein
MDMNLKDSKGRYFTVCFQAFDTSCGPACIAMVERIYKHLSSSSEQRAIDLSQKYPGKWGIDSYTNITNLSAVLNAEGVPAYAATQVQPPMIASYLRYYSSFRTPVIVHIQWNNDAGKHFSVCPVYDPPDDHFVFLDPWYGLVEGNGSTLPNYTIVGGKNTPSGYGKLSGWIVVTRPQ